MILCLLVINIGIILSKNKSVKESTENLSNISILTVFIERQTKVIDKINEINTIQDSLDFDCYDENILKVKFGLRTEQESSLLKMDNLNEIQLQLEDIKKINYELDFLVRRIISMVNTDQLRKLTENIKKFNLEKKYREICTYYENYKTCSTSLEKQISQIDDLIPQADKQIPKIYLISEFLLSNVYDDKQFIQQHLSTNFKNINELKVKFLISKTKMNEYQTIIIDSLDVWCLFTIVQILNQFFKENEKSIQV